MDTNGIETSRPARESVGNGNGSVENGEAHPEEYHSGRFLSERAKATEIDGSEFSILTPTYYPALRHR
jgi:hypothetical protein